MILVVGVNGTGKTTTIAKLAWRLTRDGHSVILAAADTFRAAAIEQLRLWGDQLGLPVVAQRAGADPGAVAFDAVAAAESRGTEAVIVDTAGRLQNKVQLMAELGKIRNVIARRLAGPAAARAAGARRRHRTERHRAGRGLQPRGGRTGIVLTKLDGTAKGGVAVTARERLGVPIQFAGMGERAGAPGSIRPGRLRRLAARRLSARSTRCRSTRLTPRMGSRFDHAVLGVRPPTTRTVVTECSSPCPRLQAIANGLRGKAKITEADLDVALREIRLALLEADVNFKVVKDFIARVASASVGAGLNGVQPGSADRQARSRRAR